MASQSGGSFSVTTPALYRIEVQGRLDESWADMLSNVTVRLRHRTAEPTVTILTGSVADQAALAGILNYIFMLGLPLLSVDCLEIGPAGGDLTNSQVN
jgi:hypothetical protein